MPSGGEAALGEGVVPLVAAIACWWPGWWLGWCAVVCGRLVCCVVVACGVVVARVCVSCRSTIR